MVQRQTDDSKKDGLTTQRRTDKRFKGRRTDNSKADRQTIQRRTDRRFKGLAEPLFTREPISPEGKRDVVAAKHEQKRDDQN